MIRVNKPTPGLDDYAYINTRIKSMRTEFISLRSLESMMESRDIMSLMETLKGSCYGPNIAECETSFKDPLKVLESATEKNLLDTIGRIKYFTEGKPKELFHIFISKYDLNNLKAVMRGIHSKTSPDEIVKCFTPIGSYSQKMLWDFAKQKTLGEFFSRMRDRGIPFASALIKAYEKYDATGKLLFLELALDKAYYDDILKNFSGSEDGSGLLIYNMFRREVDLVNSLNILRLIREKPEGVNPYDFHIRGGLRINLNLFKSFIRTSKSVKDVIKRLESIGFRREIDSRMDLYLKTNDVSVFERAFYESLERNVKKTLKYDSLGIGVLLSYIRAKMDEVVNLRIIARSVDFGMPEDIIKGELIVV